MDLCELDQHQISKSILCCVAFGFDLVFYLNVRSINKLKFYIFNAQDFVKMLTIYSRNKWETVKNKLTLLGNSQGPNEDGDGETL